MTSDFTLQFRYTMYRRQSPAFSTLYTKKLFTAVQLGILNRQSRAERQNTFDWLHILPVRVTISQYKSYSANGSHILPAEVIFCQ